MKKIKPKSNLLALMFILGLVMFCGNSLIYSELPLRGYFTLLELQAGILVIYFIFKFSKLRTNFSNFILRR